MIIAAILLVVAMGTGWLTVRLVRQIVGAFPSVLPTPPDPELTLRSAAPWADQQPPGHEIDLPTQIGKVISDGMDRVDAMRIYGADRFLTFMPMPDGTCWSLTVIRHPDEASAKASYQPTPMVTH